VGDDDRMNVPAVRDELNQALRLQYRSALQYALAAGGGRGISSLSLGDQLWAYAEAEFADLRALISRIVALGGEPVTEPACFEFEPDTVKAFESLIESEQEALAALHAVIPDTGQEPASEALEHLVEHLISRKQMQIDDLIRASRSKVDSKE
jgi:bacterioferritin (cytochrome b1)